jgi:hypothetical protein
MPPKINPKRVNVFGGGDNLPAASVDYLPMSEANRVYEEGAGILPMTPYVSPEGKRIQELEEQLSVLMQQEGDYPSMLSVQDGTLVVHDFRLTATGLIPPEEMTFEAWEQIGRLLFKLEGSIKWLIGDWLVYGADLAYGKIDTVAQSLGQKTQALYDYAYVSRHVQFSVRTENLSWSHHSRVAKLPPNEQIEALAYGVKHQMSFNDFRKWIKQGMPEGGVQGALPEKIVPRYKVTDLTESVQHLLTRDLNHVPQEIVQSKLNDLDQIERWVIESRTKLRQVMNRK